MLGSSAGIFQPPVSQQNQSFLPPATPHPSFQAFTSFSLTPQSLAAGEKLLQQSYKLRILCAAPRSIAAQSGQIKTISCGLDCCCCCSSTAPRLKGARARLFPFRCHPIYTYTRTETASRKPPLPRRISEYSACSRPHRGALQQRTQQPLLAQRM